jgi:glycyl-tRNA synthetase (class II)
MNELAKMIEKMAKEAMQQENSEVKKEVVETGKQHVESDVYNVYTPQTYERTGQLKESWDSENTTDGIAVFNTREDEDTDKYIPEVIETGQGYDYDFEYNGRERPFISNTREELRNSNRLQEAMKRDLRSKGIKVK